MPTAEAQLDSKALLTASSTFGPQEILKIVEVISSDYGQHRTLREAVQDLEQQYPEPTPAMKVRLGVGSYLLGRYQKAIEYLTKADGGALAYYYLAKSHLALRNLQQAQDAFDSASKAGYSNIDTTLGKVEALRLANKFKQASDLLDKIADKAESNAEYLYQRASILGATGEGSEATVPLLEKAVDVDPKHPGALFALAIENDRAGNDELARDLYERGVQRFPPHLGTLLNLGVLYEDREQYFKAAQCYQRILVVYPDHARAKLFLRDSEASFDMVVDEQAEKRNDKMVQVLNTPVTDFELSVRSRNCLQKMGIKTLGDLTRITEQELLASKNFGETSLNEIKDMMNSKGLRLGQVVEQKRSHDPAFDQATMSPDEQALLTKQVTELNLSVRARKCMIRLGVNTIGELIRYSGDDLLECKNFGVTSLNEVREKLTSFNLKLRGD